MSKVSRVNARLFAKMHLRQVETLIRLATIENSIGLVFDAVVPQLVALIASKSPAPKQEAFARIIQEASNKAKSQLRASLIQHAQLSHESAVDVLVKSLPKQLFERMAVIEQREESFTTNLGVSIVDTEEPSPEPNEYELANSVAMLNAPPTTRIDKRALPHAVGTHAITKNVLEDSIDVPRLLAKPKLTADEKQSVRIQVLFPPPTELEVRRIVSQGRSVTGPSGTSFQTWEQRFDWMSSQIADKKIAFNEIARGFAEGNNITQIRQKLEPLVGGIKATAQRIARTEGMRIAEQVQRSTWGVFGDMMIGAQIVAVLDERTRPEHATRNGTIYYRVPAPGRKSMAELPDLPDAFNCRCMTIPVMEPPAEYLTDPAIREAFDKTASPGTGSPPAIPNGSQTRQQPSANL